MEHIIRLLIVFKLFDVTLFSGKGVIHIKEVIFIHLLIHKDNLIWIISRCINWIRVRNCNGIKKLCTSIMNNIRMISRHYRDNRWTHGILWKDNTSLLEGLEKVNLLWLWGFS